MSDHKGSLQWEGSTDDNLSAGQFLREIENKIDERGHTTERLKINCLKNNIAYGSDADEWFSNLDATEKDTYDHLVGAFQKQWPLTAVPKTSKTERIQSLKDWVLKPEELGKKVEGPGGSQVWSHVKWATGLASKVRDAEDSTGFLLGDVYNALPRPVRDLVRKEPRSTYGELTAAVLALDTSDLKDAATTFARDKETARLAREPASPTKVLRDALTATHLQTPYQQYRAPPIPTQNPFQAPGGQGNLFGAARGNILPFRGGGPGALGMGGGTARPQIPTVQPLRSRPAAIRHQDLLQYALPHHPNTTDGQAAYRVQVMSWHAANPNRKPDEQHPYPLTPGTPAVGSRECWDCRQKGHMQSAPVCPGATLPEPERDWRRIAGFIARTFHAERLATAHAVHFIGAQQYMPYPLYNQQSHQGGYADDVDDGQGNGQGLSA